MTAFKEGDPTTIARLYGRSVGKKLRTKQQGLVDNLLPKISVPAKGPVTSAALFGDAPDHERPLHFEIGFGGGEHLAYRADLLPDHGFIGAQDYEPLSAAMTGTHDTVTVAGWWRGRDLDWAERLDRLPQGVDRTEAEAIREWDRGLLWSTLDHASPRPAPDDPAPVVDAAITHIARTPSCLALVSLEDMLGIDEQPNLPGTVDTHPNWRRRLAAPIAGLFEDEDLQRRCAMLEQTRHQNASEEYR